MKALAAVMEAPPGARHAVSSCLEVFSCCTSIMFVFHCTFISFSFITSSINVFSKDKLAARACLEILDKPGNELFIIIM
jgi:hypothetical protein